MKGLFLTILVLILVAPFAAAQEEKLISFDALVTDDAEMAGLRLRISMELKTVRGIEREAVHETAWSGPIFLSLDGTQSSSEVTAHPSELTIKSGTRIILSGTCEELKAGRGIVEFCSGGRGLFKIERGFFPSENWIDC